jgi:hypothetical protein
MTPEIELPDYAQGYNLTVEQLDKLGDLRQLPPDLQAAWDAEGAALAQEEAQEEAKKAAEAERKALGVAAPLGDWLDAQPEPVTMRQMRETPGSPAFGKAQPTVHHWLTALQRAQRVRRHQPTEMRWSGKK